MLLAQKERAAKKKKRKWDAFRSAGGVSDAKWKSNEMEEMKHDEIQEKDDNNYFGLFDIFNFFIIHFLILKGVI